MNGRVYVSLGIGVQRGGSLNLTRVSNAKLTHHGSCGASTPAFLGAVDPEVVVISVGVDNRFGHPCDEVLEWLGDIPMYRTDEQGAVEVVSDGMQVWVKVER